MHATVGARLVVHSPHVGESEQHGTVLEVRGDDGGPPYLVRYDDGRESLLFPGADCEVEHAG